MNRKKYRFSAALLLVITLVWGLCMPAFAGSASNDNSLASLGILTEGAEVSPEFTYGRTEYDVTVPAGTQKLELEPVPSHGAAWIVDITGTELTNGESTVTIIVSAENGEQYPYYLHVKADEDGGVAAPVETEPQTETEKETETEPQTEDPRYVKVDRTAMEEAEKTITALKTEIGGYRDRAGVLMKILYGLIAFCVILLFVVINLILKKKDLKSELNDYRGFGYPQESAAGYENGQDYDAEAYFDETPVKRQKKEKTKKEKPKKEKPKKSKQMPEYQQPQPEHTYRQPQPKDTYRQPSGNKQSDKDVEVTMIDL